MSAGSMGLSDEVANMNVSQQEDDFEEVLSNTARRRQLRAKKMNDKREILEKVRMEEQKERNELAAKRVRDAAKATPVHAGTSTPQKRSAATPVDNPPKRMRSYKEAAMGKMMVWVRKEEDGQRKDLTVEEVDEVYRQIDKKCKDTRTARIKVESFEVIQGQVGITAGNEWSKEMLKEGLTGLPEGLIRAEQGVLKTYTRYGVFAPKQRTGPDEWQTWMKQAYDTDLKDDDIKVLRIQHRHLGKLITLGLSEDAEKVVEKDGLCMYVGAGKYSLRKLESDEELEAKRREKAEKAAKTDETTNAENEEEKGHEGGKDGAKAAEEKKKVEKGKEKGHEGGKDGAKAAEEKKKADEEKEKDEEKEGNREREEGANEKDDNMEEEAETEGRGTDKGRFEEEIEEEVRQMTAEEARLVEEEALDDMMLGEEE